MFKISTVAKTIVFAFAIFSVVRANAFDGKITVRYGNEIKGLKANAGQMDKKPIDQSGVVQFILAKADDNLAGNISAVPVSDSRYNVSLVSYKNNPYISLSMYTILRDTKACELQPKANPKSKAKGGCLVVETGAKGTAEGYFVGSINDGQGVLRVFRSEITKKSTVEMIKTVSKLENGATVVYSQLAEAIPQIEIEKEVSSPVDLPEPVDEKTLARAQVREAILSKKPIDPSVLMKAITIQTEEELSQAEKSISGIRRSMKPADLKEVEGSGRQTCYMGGSTSLKGFFFVTLDGILKRDSSKSKVHFYCYQNGLLKIKLGALLTQRENSLGFRLPGTIQLSGAFGIGTISSVIDLVTTRLSDGSLLSYKEQRCVAGLDIGWTISFGVSAFCHPIGAFQPISFGGRIGLSAGASLSAGTVYISGLDPDDF